MRFLLIFIGLFWTSEFLSAQNILNNTANQKHVDLTNTYLSIEPPEDFVPTECYEGFERLDVQANIKVNEIEANVVGLLKGFNKKYLSDNGMKELYRENLMINNHPACLVQVEQLENGIPFNKWMLIIGDQETTYMVIGAYPKSHELKLSVAIKEALMGIYPDHRFIIRTPGS